MAKRIIRKKSVKKATSKKGKFEAIRPQDLEQIVPETSYIIKLDCEETKFLVTFKNESIVQCMALDGTYETITIPISQFNRGKYSFSYTEGGNEKQCVSVISVYERIGD